MREPALRWEPIPRAETFGGNVSRDLIGNHTAGLHHDAPLLHREHLLLSSSKIAPHHIET